VRAVNFTNEQLLIYHKNIILISVVLPGGISQCRMTTEKEHLNTGTNVTTKNPVSVGRKKFLGRKQLEKLLGKPISREELEEIAQSAERTEEVCHCFAIIKLNTQN